MKRDAAAAMEVNKNADRDLVKAAVYKTGSNPQRVWARFWWKLLVTCKLVVLDLWIRLTRYLQSKQ